jgi:hypothetical protein
MRRPLSYLYVAFNSVRIIRTIAAAREIVVTSSLDPDPRRAFDPDAEECGPPTAEAPWSGH